MILFRYLQGSDIVIVKWFGIERVLRVFFCGGTPSSSVFWQSGDPVKRVYTLYNLLNRASLLIIGILFSVVNSNSQNPDDNLWKPNCWYNACPVKSIIDITY